jgi:energy-coupling factor transporter ATP-binding protein EcfA2
MSDRALHFVEVEISRVRGVPRDQRFRLSELSSGINLIYGPNGSGKSTTASVIQELLWPGQTGLERPSVSGRFRQDGEEWGIELDAGHIQAFRNGSPGATPQFGPAENRHRYHLALHELVQLDNKDARFAKQIADASQGGYDLHAAAVELGFSDKPPGARAERKAVEELADALRSARQRQAGIHHEASGLEAREAKYADALEAERKIEILNKALGYHQYAREHREIEIEIEAIPGGVARLRGDERETLDALDRQREQLRRDQLAEEDRMAAAEAILADVNLADRDCEKETVTDLHSWQQQLARLENDVSQHTRVFDDAVASAATAQRRLGEHFSREQLEALDRIEIEPLDGLATQAEQLRAELAVYQERKTWLTTDPPEHLKNVEEGQLHEAIAALGRWLATPAAARPAPSRKSVIPGLSLTVIVALTLALALVHHVAWSGLLLLAVALFWLDRRERRAPVADDQPDDRQVHRRTFEQTALLPPGTWEIEDVVEKLRDLMGLAGELARESERVRRLQDLKSVKQELLRRKAALEEARAAIQDQLGITLDIKEHWLTQLCRNIEQWQEASIRENGAASALSNASERHRELCRKIDMVLTSFGYQHVDSAESASLRIEDLADRLRKRADALASIEEGQRRLESTIQPALRENADQRNGILERLQLEPEQESVIEEWLAQRDHLRQLQADLSRAAALRDERKQALAGHDELLNSNQVQLRQEIDREQEVADEREDIHAAIIRIKHDIQQAKDRHDLADALAAYDSAMADLEAAREASGAAVVGHTLTEWIRRVAVDQARPEVFARANEILGKITKYTLELELDDDASPPEFRARRSSGKSGSVDELSVGERVQLLMAVRIAFIEQNESIKLPLLLDETLGTCDDDRAAAVIDCVSALARDGRQVFYFTAQHDELEKWRNRLKESDVASKMINLATVRHGAVAESTPLAIEPVDPPSPPEPGGRSYLEYGRHLGVAGINPVAGSMANLHVWHLLDDGDQLYELLCRGISTCGQLRLLQEHGGAGLVDPGVLRRAGSAARAIEAACEAWRIGRGRAVDREVILASGSVSDKFIDELTALAEQCDGDAVRLIDALEAKKVSHWRQDNTESLREYCTVHGYLALEEPLDHQGIRLRCLAAVAKDIRQGILHEAMIDRLVGGLPL